MIYVKSARAVCSRSIYHTKIKLQQGKTKIIIFYKLFNWQYWKICNIACFYFTTICHNDCSVRGRYFFYSARNLRNIPAAFVFIRDKVFDADYWLFVDMICDVCQAFIDCPLLLFVQLRTEFGQTGGFSNGLIVSATLFKTHWKTENLAFSICSLFGRV